jgi:hypothetical protein
MRLKSWDRAIVQTLAPLDVATYLRSRGWHEEPRRGRDWTLFTLGTDYEIALPLSMRLHDFPYRMIEVLETLEDVENRDRNHILADLSASTADLIRVRLVDNDARDGGLPLERAAEVIRRSYDMLLAAACSTVEPRYYFPSRKPQPATDYMRRVRMGQTERGSFVVTILSPVPPDLGQPPQAESDEIPEPFERRVTEHLANALAAIDTSAKTAEIGGGIDAFEKSVEHGVSANLCDAIAGMCDIEGSVRDVEVSLTWAPARPTSGPAVIRYHMGRNIIPVLHEVARVFKSRSPQEDLEVRGPIFRLVCDPEPSSGGEITIAGFVDEAPRSIWVHLDANEYRIAADVHRDRRLVSITGVLKKEGRRYRLYTPKDFRVLPADED